jgi:glycosyltransferase involved in cell wall biosynthesis
MIVLPNWITLPLASRAGGIPDTVPEGLGFLFDVGTPASAIADFLELFVANHKKYYQLREKVIEHSEEFTWAKTVDEFLQVW